MTDYTENYDDYLNRKDSLINVKLGENTTVQDLLDIMANSGAFDFTGSISGKDTQDVADAFGTQVGGTQSIIITDLINARLDTSAKTILDSFTFGVSGAIQIGSYVNGVSGDLKISPNGILGRDKTNATTFSIDGTTGNATFAGTLSAAHGTLGDITIGTNAWHVDSSGNMWWGNFASYAAATYKISTTGVANLSGIVAASVAAENITGTTITGKNFQTLADSKLGIKIYVGDYGALATSFMEFWTDSGDATYIYLVNSTGDLEIEGGSLNVDAYVYTAGLITHDFIWFDAQTASPAGAGQIVYYDYLGTQQFRAKAGTFVGSIDLTGV